MPPCTVIPEIAYPNVNGAAEWLCDAFGFTLRVGIGDHRAQLNVGDGALVVIEMRQRAAATPDGVMIRVADVDAHHAHAVARGVRVVRPPADHPYGERQYTAVDPVGRHWTFSQSIRDVAPEEWGGTSDQL